MLRYDKRFVDPEDVDLFDYSESDLPATERIYFGSDGEDVEVDEIEMMSFAVC